MLEKVKKELSLILDKEQYELLAVCRINSSVRPSTDDISRHRPPISAPWDTGGWLWSINQKIS